MEPAVAFRPRVVPLDPVPGVERLLCALGAGEGSVWLDSAGGAPRRHSLLGLEPRAAFPGGDGSDGDDAAPRTLAALGERLARWRELPGDPVPGPFAGGFLGALAYDLGVDGAEGVDGSAAALPADPWGAPPIVGGLYTDFVVLDHDPAGPRGWLVLGEVEGEREPWTARRDRHLAALAAAAPAEPRVRPAGPLRRHTPPAEHMARVERLRALIAAGDLYQANLAHRFTRAVAGDPVDLYRRLRRTNPGPYMAWLRFRGGALLSASPELLVEVADGRARTRPIKGTAPRGATPEADRRAGEELLASAKDRAELAMIVDLERNDLGRVARAGGVTVEGLPTLETYAAVHHLVADVRAELAEGCGALDVLRALFPGGSITGAPKGRAMRRIGELEGEGRGFFTGSAGFLDLRDRAAFNILIRTLVWRPAPGGAAEGGDGGEVSFHVGGGITARSDAALEERETLAKGAALAAALAAEGEADAALGMTLVPPPGPA